MYFDIPVCLLHNNKIIIIDKLYKTCFFIKIHNKYAEACLYK